MHTKHKHISKRERKTEVQTFKMQASTCARSHCENAARAKAAANNRGTVVAEANKTKSG